MDGDIPSISSGSVGSRFVSQADIEKAKLTRDEQWRAAYARLDLVSNSPPYSHQESLVSRLGQEPPPRPQEDADYDGRSLYEVSN
jgi:hypothetical protein